MTENNLFYWATSELSQDAFLCYLIIYAKEEYSLLFKEEHRFALKLRNHMLKKVWFDIEIKSIEVKKQVMKIDVLLIINNEYYLIIEDKTFTDERYNQIKSYIENLVNSDKAIDYKKVKGLYFKTGDESYQNLQSKETASMMRKEIIEVFKEYSGNNIIILDYLKNLKEIEKKRMTFENKSLRVENYNWTEIIGFYNRLDEEFILLKEKGIMPEEIKFNWEYTPNQSGGFMCYYFQNVLDFAKYGFYLQLESTDKKNTENPQENLKLVVKVWYDEKNIDVLYKGFEVFKDNWSDKIDFSRPARFSKGTWMTQLIINNYIQFKSNGTIDSAKTALKIVELLCELRELKLQLERLL